MLPIKFQTISSLLYFSITFNMCFEVFHKLQKKIYFVIQLRDPIQTLQLVTVYVAFA